MQVFSEKKIGKFLTRMGIRADEVRVEEIINNQHSMFNIQVWSSSCIDLKIEY
jgi:hypothetical protein